jgi:glycosyltransferase involved in cell wall biosynthesis
MDIPLVSISNAQRAPIPWANWQGTVYHGLPENHLQFTARPKNYLAFTGRIAPEKRPDWAIEIARRAGIDLIIAAKISKVDQPYFDAVVKPLLKQPGVEFIGEIDDVKKGTLIGEALSLLFPIDWPEPFGLVLIEAMACGTPVIAFGRGSVPEIIEHERSGFIVNNIDEAVDAIRRVPELDRRVCRQCFESRFTAARMARDYLQLYHQRARGLDVAARSVTAAAPLCLTERVNGAGHVSG